MSPKASGQLKLRELASHAGVSPRTVRLYISRGLLPGPLKRGRGAVYGTEHAERLDDIRRLQRDGLTLKEIADTFAAKEAGGTVPPAESWSRFAITEDVEVAVRDGASPWWQKRIRKALAQMAADLGAARKER